MPDSLAETPLRAPCTRRGRYGRPCLLASPEGDILIAQVVRPGEKSGFHGFSSPVRGGIMGAPDGAEAIFFSHAFPALTSWAWSMAPSGLAISGRRIPLHQGPSGQSWPARPGGRSAQRRGQARSHRATLTGYPTDLQRSASAAYATTDRGLSRVGWAADTTRSSLGQDASQYSSIAYETSSLSYKRLPFGFLLNIRVGIVEVPCKGERSFDLMTEMVENPQKEKGVAAFLEGGRPWGASEVASPVLRCGMKPGPVLQTVQLELGGNRTEDLEVEVEYRFSQVTACSCCCGEEPSRK